MNDVQQLAKKAFIKRFNRLPKYASLLDSSWCNGYAFGILDSERCIYTEIQTALSNARLTPEYAEEGIELVKIQHEQP